LQVFTETAVGLTSHVLFAGLKKDMIVSSRCWSILQLMMWRYFKAVITLLLNTIT